MPALAVERQVGSIMAGKYRLVRILGRGGMGIVYEAEHTMTRRRVAVKVLHAHHKESGDAARRFINEAQAAGRIDHPNVVEVLDAGEDADGSLYLVLELLVGQDLATMLARQRRLEVAEAVTVVAQVLQALVVAHRIGIIHRDIKPENIFLTKSMTGDTHVKILDFGISKAMESSGQGPALSVTQTNTTVGTPHYMSPEQARGERTIDTRADLWAVGVVMYESLSGKVPFDGDTYNDQIVKVITEPHASLSQYDVPLELSRVVDRALEKDKSQRYARAAEMLADIRSFITKHPEYSSVPMHYLREPAPSRTPLPQAPRLPNAPTVETALDPNFDPSLPPASDTIEMLSPLVSDESSEDVPTVVRPYPEDPRGPKPLPPLAGSPPVLSLREEELLEAKRRRIALAALGVVFVVFAASMIALATRTKPAPVVAIPNTSVVLRFVGAPPGARVSIGGASIPHPEGTILPRSAQTVTVQVDAPGFQTARFPIKLDRDQTIPLMLAAAPPTPPPAPASADDVMQFEPDTTTATGSPSTNPGATAHAASPSAARTGSSAAPAVVPRSTGFISIRATPMCTLYVDGQLRGHTPMIHLGLVAGQHRILCRTSTGAIRSRLAVVTSGHEADVTFAP